MQTKNNYQIQWLKDGEEGSGIFNGDIGIIESVDKVDSTVTIHFDDDRVSVYPFNGLIEIELAYAMTVHKSQGNEFNAVILPLFSVPSRLCYRNLLYTAVTRAKKMIILVGDEQVVDVMTQNDSKTKRYTAFKEFLIKESEENVQN
jgi:exodeoxyribonuclease V alpha subunit